jgi:hypothetical protein
MTTARPRGSRLAALGMGALGLGTAFALAAPSGGDAAAQETPASGDRPDATAARVSAHTRQHVRRGGVVLVKGAVRPAASGRTVHVQISRGRGWHTVDRARTGRGGRYRAAWRQHTAGRYAVRVVLRGGGATASASSRAGGRLNVYRPAHASWYGPGFYGNRTACGQTLGANTLGVAHKSLPCGTRVTFRYRGRSITVPVIDRGPYAAGREWDLTGATKRRLGFGSTGTVWSTR